MSPVINLKIRPIILFILSFSFFTVAKAQTNADKLICTVSPSKFNNFEIDAFTPNADFLTQNPDFLKDGAYELSALLIKDAATTKVQSKLTNNLGSNYNSWLIVSSKQYPVINFPMTGSLAFLNNSVSYHLYVPQLFKPFHNDKELHQNDIKASDILPISAGFGITDFEFHTDNYLNTPSATSFTTSLPVPCRKADELTFTFTETKTLAMPTDQFGNTFPGYALFELKIQDVSGSVLKTYYQAVFFSSRITASQIQNTRTYPYQMAAYGYYLYPVALQNILGQLANDSEFINKIKLHQQQMQQFAANNPEYLNYIDARKLIIDLQQKKEDEVATINIFNKELNTLNAPQLADVGQIDLSAFADPNKNADVAVGSIANATAALLDILKIADENKKIENLNMGGRFAIDWYNKYQGKEDSVVKVQSPSVVKMLEADSLFQKDKNLNKAFSQSQNDLTSATSTATDKVQSANDRFLDQVKSAFNPPETEAVTAGGGTTTPASPGLTACQEQTATAWKSSPEYITFMNSKNLADGEYAKEKLVEMTIASCGNMISPHDLAVLKQAAIDFKANGDKLRYTPHYTYPASN